MEKRILTLLEKNPAGLEFQDILDGLRLKRREKNALRESLAVMEREKSLRRRGRLYLPVPRAAVVRGVFSAGPRGFGFVAPEDGGGDIFIPARFAAAAVTGDIVEVVRREAGRRGKPEGRIVKIARKTRKTLLGIYREKQGFPYLSAFDSASSEEIPLKSKGGLKPEEGMIIEADRASLKITEVLGRPDDPGVDTETVIRKFDLPAAFPADVVGESESARSDPPVADGKTRRDFTNWMTVTIDGEDARDFDDAVSWTPREGGGCLLGIHIADVSFYVGTGTALDREAFRRGTSVYFPDSTLPMLPEKLSNDLCSLRPRRVRPALSALMEIDENGRVGRTEFCASLIRTSARLTYTAVAAVFDGDEAESSRLGDIVPHLLAMRDLARKMRDRRRENGSLDFDLDEPELIYRGGVLQAVAAAERNEAHRLIEEFMIAANVAAASFLSEKGYSLLYRVHPAPAPESLEKLRELLSGFSVSLPAAETATSGSLQAVLDRFRGRPEEKFIGVQVLRAMKPAVYSEKNSGHFGLALSEYAHFTSPIRRYPDLVVHRIMKRALAGKKPEKLPLDVWALHCSERERTAAEAEKTLLQWRILRFLKTRLGDEFNGIIVDINRAGLVVELEDYFVDGLMPFSALGGDYYRRQDSRTLKGRRGGVIFQVGRKIRVSLLACDPVLRRMEFGLADEPEDL
ncbi:MAG: ribonuclease R [Acidobacteriota bacterium]|nr:ribonuclease R [Acidobacteriota bacterium]